MSPSITVAVVGATGVAQELAKKSTSSDITLYHQVQDGHALTLVEPTQYPEKFPPLLYSLALSDRAVLVADRLDRGLAETAATLDLFDLPTEVWHGPAVGPDELARAFRGLTLEKVPVRALDLVALREELSRLDRAPVAGPPVVAIDHYFPVKGVGTVALGFVRQGTVEAHARLRLYPTERTVELRSIQVHDVDVRSAASGERVGLALRGIEVSELSRGQLLAPEGALRSGRELSGSAGRVSPYYRGDLVVGAQLHALVGSQFVPAQVTSREGDRIVVETDRPVAWAPGESLRLADLSTPKGARGIGRWTLAGETGPTGPGTQFTHAQGA